MVVDQATLKVRVIRERCQGHARCAALAPGLFELDEIGNGVEIGDGLVPAGMADDAHLARDNCPEDAIEITQVTP
jgi:ferredoxin